MSDTEEVVLKRKPRNTKPEVAREKLKEKRERLKKEKENAIIEEAKKRLVAEEENRKAEEQKKKELAEADPMTLMMRRMEEMMSRFDKPKPELVEEEEVKPKRKSAPRKKKEPEVVYAEEPKPIPKQRKPRRKVVYEDAIESPSNVFVGNARANIPSEPQPEEYYQQEQPGGNPLLNALASRRGMSSWY